MPLPGVTSPGLYIRNGRLYVVYRGRFGKLRHFHMAYVDGAGEVEYRRPNEGISVHIGHVCGCSIELTLEGTAEETVSRLGTASSSTDN